MITKQRKEEKNEHQHWCVRDNKIPIECISWNIEKFSRKWDEELTNEITVLNETDRN